ncbi:acetyl-CoA carboxylase biotin carboxyl carrier protein [Coxiella endosymbiont of Amblyomma americanum]|uniref:acetyl-CoA carboxylase biotin carboxyl carrier protein n=1 Tax=Coxiella endosymbiont of Amblyomma americanum TaxID=325775 RepID=UPI00057FDEEB|nr:acetyl-CoA carboxylase biotin carboxyl carrier protein [Coxiella-like endosymbiont of Amblyomma americanum]AJC50209.1 biotin carboxyl carrier protein [Coxiella endosymbiont of Amblyomma americanum]AUJ58571.1 acetyl-CoA carboxylase biotin carboxyl carrier protein subunit [Coxiella-like endosymbiont of Amblyomma americanum]
MDIRKIKRLIKLINKTRIKEIAIKSGEESMHIVQFSQQKLSESFHPTTVVKDNLSESSNSHNQITSEITMTSSSNTMDNYPLKSPMVGTVYLSPTPGAQPFVEIGQKVSIGDTVCLIEAMKIFNNIEADKSGIISACLVENEQPVEFGQPLFLISQ